MKEINSLPTGRYLTRALARTNRITIQDYSLEDLDAASSAVRAQTSSKILQSLSKPSAVTAQDTSREKAQSSEQKSKKILHVVPTRAQRQKESNTGNDRYVQSRAEDEIRIERSSVPAELRPNDQHDRLSDWLVELRPLTPQDPPSPVTSEPHQQYLDMAEITSSSSLNTTESAVTQQITHTDTSTTKRKAGEMSYLENLKFRGVSRESSHDDKLEELGFDKITDNLSNWIDFQNLTSLVKLLENYTKKLKKGMKEQAMENGFYDYDALRQEVCEWRPVPSEHRRFAPMPTKYFDWDKRFCSHAGSSEADFHRTLMPSIIDRYDFQNMFTFTCEELWAVSERFLLPARRKIPKIPQPKPDLAISFDHSSITDSEMTDFPPGLVSCLHPGKNGDERWYPFFFMEAKKGDGSLSHAFQRNLCSASQALFNIFQWMRLSPELEQQFFTEVRVFTVDINNKDALLRMHRAEKGSEAHLQYKFVEVTEIRNYNRIQICHIIKTVLLDYAAAILHPVLKKTFQQVAEMGTSVGIGKKRKDYQGELNREAPGRGNSSQDTVLPRQQSHTGLSFPTEALTTSDVENAPKRSRPRRKANAADETDRSDSRT